MGTPKRVKYIYIKKNRLKNSKGIEFSQAFLRTTIEHMYYNYNKGEII